MGVILRHLRDQGPQSRAQLATGTGLSKAAITSLVSALVELHLVREGNVDRQGRVGRPGTEVTLRGDSVWGIGLEINADYLLLSVTDLTGAVIREVTESLSPEEHAPDTLIDRAAAMIRTVLADAEDTIIGAITVAPPGVIDYQSGLVRFAPNLGWRAVPLVSLLEEALPEVLVPIYLENDAKLSALAAFNVLQGSDVHDLVYVAGDVGVGAGIIADGQLVRGWSGFSGEVGHMLLDANGPACACGRRGCFELYVGLRSFLALLPRDDPDDAAMALADRLEELRRRMLAGDEAVLRALDVMTGHLVRGMSLIVDVLNPQLIVLGGYFGYFAEHIVPVLSAALEKRQMADSSHADVESSSMGIAAAARGGAQMSLERVFMDPSVLGGLLPST